MDRVNTRILLRFLDVREKRFVWKYPAPKVSKMH
jgi:hypothetical protein